jgi:hypothetical protein
MMFTSQEGELYLGQARALGAMGVLPKQVKHAELSSTLFQLGLLPDRRAEASRGPRARGEAAAVAPLFPAEDAAAAPASAASSALPLAAAVPPAAAASSALPPAAEDSQPAVDPPPAAAPAIPPLTAAELRPVIESVLREQFGELRRHVDALFEQQSARWLDDLRAAVVPPPPPPIALEGFADDRRSGSTRAWMLALAATLAAATLGVLWWRESQASRELLAQLLDARRVSAAQVAPVPTALPASPVALVAAGAAASDAAVDAVGAATTAAPVLATATDAPVVRAVPYGELPLAGERLEALRALVTDLASRGVRGVVSVASYPGRFCLVGSPAQGFAPASDELAATRCDVVGNPFDEALLPGQRESLAVANFMGSVRQQSGGALRVELVTGAESERVRPYPAESAGLTAGEWNRAAAANNRIEVRLRREPS